MKKMMNKIKKGINKFASAVLVCIVVPLRLFSIAFMVLSTIIDVIDRYFASLLYKLTN